MIEAAAILAGSGVLGLVGVIVWLVVKLLGRTDQLSDARQAQSVTEEHAMEANYKLQQTQLALASALKLNDQQAKELADAIGVQPNTDLPPDDVHDRLVRWLAANTSATTADRDPAGAAMPADAAAATTQPRAG